MGEQAHHLAFDCNGLVWITQPTRRVAVVDAVSRVVRAEVSIAGMPHHLALAGRWMVIADHDRGMALVFNSDTRQQVAEVPIAAGPHGPASAPSQGPE
ncbi:YncE family protein [Prauserella oleivorans]|uniref:YncE family protein n=1 Tax=Prauserella oleivorans TaxID=1478153 RepID=UPI0036296715